MKHSQFIFLFFMLSMSCSQKTSTEESMVDSTAVDTTSVIEDQIAEEVSEVDSTYEQTDEAYEEGEGEDTYEEESVGEGPGGYPDPLVSLDGKWVRVYIDATQSMEFFFPTETTELSKEITNMVIGYPKFKEGTKLLSVSINFAVMGGPCTPGEFPGNLTGYTEDPAVIKEYAGVSYTAYTNDDHAMQKAYTTNGYFLSKDDVCYVFALLREESTYSNGPDDPGLPAYDEEKLFNAFDAMMNSIKYRTN